MAMRRRQIVMLVPASVSVSGLAMLAAAGARAQGSTPPGPPGEVATEISGARLQGAGTLRFLGLRVYDARLWVGPAAMGPDWTVAPLALELDYARSLDGAKIAERSLSEMRRQGDMAADAADSWLAAMKLLFPDVKAGDRLTGLNVPGLGVRFFVNGRFKGDLRDTTFARYFFGIWLSPKTSEPALRDSLLGKAP